MVAGRMRNYATMAVFMSYSTVYGRELRVVQDNTESIGKGDIMLFCTLRNEAFRIPHFLEHYRGLGVQHFVFVDNGSEDDFQRIVQDDEDVSVWYTEKSYKKSSFGMHWLT